jgi:hypothetical protein
MKLLLALMPLMLLGQSGLTPAPKVQFFNDDGTPMVGGKLCTYQGGTSTPLNVFTDSALTVPHANPIVLDSRGETTIWLSSAATYKFVLRRPGGVSSPLVTACSDTTQVWSVDNIAVASGGGGGGGASLPVDDTTSIVQNVSDNTKRVRISAAALSPITTRVMTMPDANLTIAGSDIAQTWSQVQTFGANLVPSAAGFYNVGTNALPFSTAIFAQYIARPAGGTCNYAGLTSNAISGGTVFAQDSACSTQALMSATGFDTVNTIGQYRIQGTTVINPSRHLENIAGVATNLIPTTDGTRDLGSSANRYRDSYLNSIYTDAIVPNTAGTGTVGTSAVQFGQGHFINLRAHTDFRFKSSATPGHVLTAIDSLGFADWAAPPTGTLPTQTGQAGKFLTTDGTNASWDTVSGAGISSLNGETGATQTFANDTNVTISSATNTHTLGWTGQLSAARGGTGLSAFTRTGNTTEFASWTGAKTSGRCVQIDASGNLQEASGACGGGGGGLISLNAQNTSTYPNQTFTVTDSGSDFVISSVAGVHLFNLPSASTSARGLVTTADQTFAGVKRFQDGLTPVSDGAASLGTTGNRWATVFTNTLALRDGVGNGFTSNAVPITNFTFTLGNSNYRWDQYWGRLINLRTNGSSVASITARDNSNNLTFSMGDGGGTGGEFSFYNSGGSEYFSAINGQVRFNSNNGQTTSVVIGGCTLTFNQGGLTAKSGC